MSASEIDATVDRIDALLAKLAGAAADKAARAGGGLAWRAADLLTLEKNLKAALAAAENC